VGDHPVIEFSASAEGFALSWKGRRLLSHSLDQPCLRLGRGEGRYDMVRGHFHLRDRLQRRVACGPFRVLERRNDRVAVEFPGFLRADLGVKQDRLELRPSGAPPWANRLWLDLVAEPREHVYGGGEQFSVLDLKGRRFPVWVQEQGVGRSRDPITLVANLQSGSGGKWYNTYFPLPLLVSSSNWYCLADFAAYSELDLRSSRRHRLHFRGIPERLVFDAAATAPDLLGSLSSLMGRQPPLAEWTQDGIWLGVQGGTEAIRGKLARAREAGVRVAALWVQDWEGRRVTSFGSQLMWNWVYDAERYPQLTRLIEELHGEGIRFLGYINPFLAVEKELYREASARGYCVKDAEGRDLLVTVTTFPAALLDLTHPDAVAWIKAVIRENMIGIGLDGWMADYGEYLPPGAHTASGKPWEELHNLYPALWARVNREAIREAGREGEVVFFMRAGFTGSTAHAPLFWAGDQLVNWGRGDGLPTVIPAAVSLGLQGVGQHHSDIGGFTSLAWVRRSKELFLRWAEQAAFSPLMRTHEGNRPATQWQFHSDSETLGLLARATEIFARLKPYRLRAFGEYQSAGLPLMRHPYLHYESDAVLHRLAYQYLLGRDLLVAPVLRPRMRSWRVYLPDDAWVHLWTGATLAPGWRHVGAPLGRPPVFYRADSPFRRDFEALREL
jgi:alpha-glucosidase